MAAADDTKEALAAFTEYTKAFRSLDAKAVARHFHVPSIMVTPDNVDLFNSESDVERAYAPLMAGLPAMGYDRTDFINLRALRLSDDTANVTGVAVWKKADGTEIQRAGMTYTLRRHAGIWKHLCALIHEPQVYL